MNDDELEPRQTHGRLFLVLLVLACALGAGAALYQLRPGSQRGAREACEKLLQAVQRRDLAALQRLVSANYRDGRGLSRDPLLRQLFLFLDAHGYRRIVPVSIEVGDRQRDGTALVVAKIWLAQAEAPPRGRRDAVRVDLALREENGAWRVTSAQDWELPEDGFEVEEEQ